MVHELFEQIRWYADSTPEVLRQYAEQNGVEQRALGEVVAALESADVRSALAQPDPQAQVWLEKRFEIILDREWLTGTFDRVVILPDGTASILDFKTDTFPTTEPEDNELAAKAAIYEPQLALYRRVLAKMTGIPESSISCALLFTKARRIWN